MLTYKKKWARFLHGNNLNREWLQSLNFAGAGEGAWGQAVTLKHTQSRPWQGFVVDITKDQIIPLLFDLASSRAEKHSTHSGKKSRLFFPTSEFGRNDCSPDRLFSAPISHLALLPGCVLCLSLLCSWPQEAGRPLLLYLLPCPLICSSLWPVTGLGKRMGGEWDQCRSSKPCGSVACL